MSAMSNLDADLQQLALNNMLHVWFVKGDEYATPFLTKLDAEVAARSAFPNENEDQRYARIYYRDVVHFE